MPIVDSVRAVCEELGGRLTAISGLVTTEADAQAELHAALLRAFPEQIPIEAEEGLLKHGHHVWPIQGSRAYREISAGSSRATSRSDIILLRDEPQVLVPKANGAPARFGRAAACLIEIKLDLGRTSNSQIAPSIQRDFEKWAAHVAGAESDSAVAVVFTDRPKTYLDLGNPYVIPVECATGRSHKPVVDSVARQSLREAIALTIELHRSNPLTMLREKDFETRILSALRSDGRITAGNAVSQHRLRCSRTGQLRPLDIAVFGVDPSRPAGVAELKTSHSKTFKTLGRNQLEDEAAFLDTLVNEGAEVEVAIFRYGVASVADDQIMWRAKWPNLQLNYAEC